MKKKLLIMLISIFMITGCNVEYDLDFYNGEFSDTINLGRIDVKEGEQFEIVNIESIIDQNGYYNVEQEDDYWYLSYKYNIDEYKRSEVLNKCFDYSNVDYGEDYYYISASGFKCLDYNNFQIDSITVRFKSDLEIEESNEDEIISGNYVWTFDKSNPDKDIYIKLKRNTNGTTDDNEDSNKDTIRLIVLIVFTIIIITFGIYMMFKKNKKIKEDI